MVGSACGCALHMWTPYVLTKGDFGQPYQVLVLKILLKCSLHLRGQWSFRSPHASVAQIELKEYTQLKHTDQFSSPAPPKMQFSI